jgi:hypothetical protein
MPESGAELEEELDTGTDPEATSAEPGPAANALTAGYPETCTGALSPGGNVVVCYTWYNRSVGLDGSVWDYPEGPGPWGTTAIFDFYQGGNYLFTQTRTDSPGEPARGFGFVADASGLSGGITLICVKVCNTAGALCGERICDFRP